MWGGRYTLVEIMSRVQVRTARANSWKIVDFPRPPWTPLHHHRHINTLSMNCCTTPEPMNILVQELQLWNLHISTVCPWVPVSVYNEKAPRCRRTEAEASTVTPAENFWNLSWHDHRDLHNRSPSGPERRLHSPEPLFPQSNKKK